MALDDEDMTTTGGFGAEGPADSGAGSGTPGEHDGGADGGAEGPADSGAGGGTRASTTAGRGGAARTGRLRRGRGYARAHDGGADGARTAVPADPAVTDAASPVTGRPAVGRPEPGPLARCVGDPDVFAAQFWGRRRLTRNAVGGFDLLTSTASTSSCAPRPADPVHPHGEGGTGARLVASPPRGVGAEIDQVRDDKVAAHFAGIPVFRLRTWPPVIALHPARGRARHPVQANPPPPSSRGFSAHYDVHDVFVLQLAGRKHWTIHAPVLADPLRDQPWGQRSAAVAAAAQEQPVIDTVLEPGDALYLPRGWLHAATALGEVSAHLTVGIHVVTRFALVEALAALVADDPALRATLPLGIDVADPAALAPHLDAVRAALAEALHRVPDEAVARRVRRRVWSGGRPEPVGVVAGTAFAAGLAVGDVVRLRVGLHHRLRPAGEHVVLELPDRGDQPARLHGGGPACAGARNPVAVGNRRRWRRPTRSCWCAGCCATVSSCPPGGRDGARPRAGPAAMRRRGRGGGRSAGGHGAARRPLVPRRAPGPWNRFILAGPGFDPVAAAVLDLWARDTNGRVLFIRRPGRRSGRRNGAGSGWTGGRGTSPSGPGTSAPRPSWWTS